MMIRIMMIMEMQYGRILLAPQMRLILASYESVESAADRIQKEAQNKLPQWGFETRP